MSYNTTVLYNYCILQVLKQVFLLGIVSSAIITSVIALLVLPVMRDCLRDYAC